MKVTKILFYDIVCPHCGTKIRLDADEFEKYRKSTEGYGGSVITCQLDENEHKEDKCRDIDYVNFDCPVCKGYIPIISDESDRFGFKPSKCVTPFYGIPEDVSIDKYIKNWFNKGHEVEDEEADYITCEI